jgi:predicted RNase H-like HicB family nuclease
MGLQFTAVFRKVPEGYIGYVEELPGANTQGATLAEAGTNLREAVEMVLEANRELSDAAHIALGVSPSRQRGHCLTRSLTLNFEL